MLKSCVNKLTSRKVERKQINQMILYKYTPTSLTSVLLSVGLTVQDCYHLPCFISHLIPLKVTSRSNPTVLFIYYF